MRERTIFAFLLLIFILYSAADAASMRSADYIIKDSEILSASGGASSKDYILRNVQIGDMASGKAKSADYILEAFPLSYDEMLPKAPSLNPVPPITNNPKLLISGTKDRASSICINGYVVIPLDNETTWSYSLTLSEGRNYFVVTAANCYHVESSAVGADIFLDTSAPTTPAITDDGDFTSSLSRLNAKWTAEDAQTGIVEYQYAIGTAPYMMDVSNWISAGVQCGMSRADLSLVQGKTYYVSVKAANGAGSWSKQGSSNGIKVNQTVPTITNINPPSGTGSYVGGNISFMVSAQDKDGDSILYRFLLDGKVIQPWQANPNFDWATAGLNSGVYSMKTEVSDNNGGQASGGVDLYLFRKPISPPAL